MEALIRFAYFVVGHHDWSVSVITEALERWQSTFFEQPRHADPRDLMPLLSTVGRSIVRVRPALQRMRGTSRSPPFRRRRDLALRADDQARSLREVGAEVRDAYAMAASATSLYQADQAELKATRDRRFQRVASVFAALVLWPGLVAAIYGADVKGLPGQGTTHGLVVVAVVSALGALIILVPLLFILRARSPARYPTLAPVRDGADGGKGD